VSAEVVLVLPPQWTPQNPPFALACLGGHLRSRGISTRLRDLNLDFYCDILTPEHMRFVREVARMRRQTLVQRCRMRLMVDPGASSPALARDSAHLERLDRFLEMSPDPWERAARALPDALSVMRDGEAFYVPERLLAAMATVDLALELAALPWFPSQLALNAYYNQEDEFTVDALERATRDEWTNMFRRAMREAVPDLLAEGAPLIAISINAYSQVVPGLTLARLLKEAARPGTHVGVGGNFFGRVAERLVGLPRFFELFCHSVVVGEGEEALERLARAVVDGNPLADVPDAIWLDGEGVRRNRRNRPRMPLAQAGCLDLEGLDLVRYLTPEPVLCYQTSRGCYFSKCTFCDAYWGSTFDRRPLGQVVDELKRLNRRYGIRHFELIDECLPPDEMAALAQAISEAGLDLRWFANARLEDAFVDQLAGLHGSGCTMLLWGFESGARRIFKKIAKGVSFEGRWEALRASAAAGLWNFAYIFFGFPSETIEEARETIRAICEHTDIIHSYGRSVFSMGLHSPMARRPRAFGITEVVEGGEELSVDVTFTCPEGPTAEQVTLAARECTERCRAAYGSPLWMGLRNRENLHLYLARYGAARVSEWSIEVEEAHPAFQK
jgi:hypothetical protein